LLAVPVFLAYHVSIAVRLLLQCPPPNIDFVLPSPTIGLPMVTVVDPPWQPHLKTKVEEVALNQEESVSEGLDVNC
jgi:hypothetical protein